ncbi:hypothetical protein Tco_1132494 [Tanacetum coccineum]|uniref:Uncharacterized protein n=1 Tax=Tanacetum coccineum TaxID=301880 RepID=A0ABQ5JF38_9ASTR
MRSIISTVSISLKDFILLLMVITVAVVIVTVIWVVIFVNVIVGVVILGQMTYLVTSSTLDSAISCVMQGAFCTQRKVSMVSFRRISPKSFRFSLQESSKITSTCHWQQSCVPRAGSKTQQSVLPDGIIVMAGVSDSLRGYDKDEDNDANGGNDDEREIDNVVEEEDEEHICFLGGNSSSGIKKYRGLNSSDGGITGDGVKIAGGVIGSSDEIGFDLVLYNPWRLDTLSVNNPIFLQLLTEDVIGAPKNAKTSCIDDNSSTSLTSMPMSYHNLSITLRCDNHPKRGSKKVEVKFIGLHFLNFFNDPRIIREQRIAAYKGYRGGGVGHMGDDVESLGAVLERLWCKVEVDGGGFCSCGVRD